MPNFDKAMGDIDDASSLPQVPAYQSPPEPPIIGSIDLAPHGGIYGSREISAAEQCPGSTVEYVTGGFGDDVAQYKKTGNEGLLKVRNQAWELAVPNDQQPLIGKTDSDPIGG